MVFVGGVMFDKPTSIIILDIAETIKYLTKDSILRIELLLL